MQLGRSILLFGSPIIQFVNSNDFPFEAQTNVSPAPRLYPSIQNVDRASTRENRRIYENVFVILQKYV